jgi:serine protease Do
MNSDYDLALIQLPEGKYPSLSLYTDTPLDIGQNVYAIGTPVDMILGQSVTKGIASGFRKINGVNFIQTDVSINAGNSGGALVDQDGRLMGITTIKASGTGIEGLGFCLPSKTIEHALSISYK